MSYGGTVAAKEEKSYADAAPQPMKIATGFEEHGGSLEMPVRCMRDGKPRAYLLGAACLLVTVVLIAAPSSPFDSRQLSTPQPSRARGRRLPPGSDRSSIILDSRARRRPGRTRRRGSRRRRPRRAVHRASTRARSRTNFWGSRRCNGGRSDAGAGRFWRSTLAWSLARTER